MTYIPKRTSHVPSYKKILQQSISGKEMKLKQAYILPSRQSITQNIMGYLVFKLIQLVCEETTTKYRHANNFIGHRNEKQQQHEMMCEA